ncbi:MAG TPA: J domain-containing protein [Methylocystis sp.]|nr:J domain-containing protein [Methylocystis sp.]
MTDKAEWVVWNGSLGILDMATIGLVEVEETRRRAFLAPPYGVVGPFSLDELEASGCIAFGECLVMSRQKWRDDQVELRTAAQERRRALLLRMQFSEDESEHRDVLDLPLQGALQALEINAAFRRLAKTAHPDAGGSDEDYRRITTARDALLKRYSSSG